MSENPVETARKLLRLKERAGSAAEAAAAAKVLAALLDRHRIGIAELESSGKLKPEGFYADKERPLTSWKRIEPWRRNLALVIADHFGVCCWQEGYREAGQAMEHRLCLCGKPSDVELVRSMYHWLGAELVYHCGRECRRKGARYARSWRDGFVRGISEQLRALRGELCETDTRAVVLYDRASDAREHLLSVLKMPEARKFKTRHKYNRYAFFSGLARGAHLHLGERIGEPDQQELPWNEDDSCTSS